MELNYYYYNNSVHAFWVPTTFGVEIFVIIAIDFPMNSDIIAINVWIIHCFIARDLSAKSTHSQFYNSFGWVVPETIPWMKVCNWNHLSKWCSHCFCVPNILFFVSVLVCHHRQSTNLRDIHVFHVCPFNLNGKRHFGKHFGHSFDNLYLFKIQHLYHLMKWLSGLCRHRLQVRTTDMNVTQHTKRNTLYKNKNVR